MSGKPIESLVSFHIFNNYCFEWCEVYEIIHIWTAVVDESKEWSLLKLENSLRWSFFTFFQLLFYYIHTKWSQQNQKGNHQKTISLIDGWIHSWTRSKQWIRKSWIFTLFSNMANDSFNFFVSSFVNFSIKGLKENAENLNYYPILRRKVELYLFLSTHREWESFLCRFLQMLSTAATIKVSVVYLQSSLPC